MKASVPFLLENWRRYTVIDRNLADLPPLADFPVRLVSASLSCQQTCPPVCGRSGLSI
jgi:hypothetical protein